MLINTVYRATEGEGVRIGTPQIFVRLQGCNIGCANCDSKQTWAFDKNFDRPTETVIKKIRELANTAGNKIKWVSITGGDPLHPGHLPEVRRVIEDLGEDFFINLEASGNKIVEDIFKQLDFISFDYKTPSTGVKTNYKLIALLARDYPDKFQVKSVIQDTKDFQDVHRALLQVEKELKVSIPFPWCLTPAYNTKEEFPLMRFQTIIRENEKIGGSFRVIGQQHKWIYGPDREDV